MNTQLAFAFGMLTVAAIIILIAIVVGMLKVGKQQDKITSLEKWIDDTNRFAENNVQDIHRVVSMNQENIERVIQDEVRKLMDDIATVHRRIDEVYSTMDSRFDKFENKITKKPILKD